MGQKGGKHHEEKDDAKVDFKAGTTEPSRPRPVQPGPGIAGLTSGPIIGQDARVRKVRPSLETTAPAPELAPVQSGYLQAFQGAHLSESPGTWHQVLPAPVQPSSLHAELGSTCNLPFAPYTI